VRRISVSFLAVIFVFGLIGMGNAVPITFLIESKDSLIQSGDCSFEGQGDILYARILGKIAATGKAITWADMPQTKYLSAKDNFNVDFLDGLYRGIDNPRMITTTVTAHSAPVPEPVTLLLLGTGILGLAGFRRKRKSQ
jgi:hypothetical protein